MLGDPGSIPGRARLLRLSFILSNLLCSITYQVPLRIIGGGEGKLISRARGKLDEVRKKVPSSQNKFAIEAPLTFKKVTFLNIYVQVQIVTKQHDITS